MISQALKSEYIRFRRTRRRTPETALTMARAAIATGKASIVVYSSFIPAATIGAPFKVGNDNCRWIERPADYGLRFVGYADKVARSIRHTGWFLDDDGMSGETARGVVFQFPARNGTPLFVAGVADPFNDGPAIVAFDTTDDELTAAIWADRVAEIYAENERDYRRASSARIQFEELGDAVAQHRRDCLALIREIKARASAFGPNICAALRDHVESHIRDIQKARAKRASLESDFAHCDGWQSY